MFEFQGFCDLRNDHKGMGINGKLNYCRRNAAAGMGELADYRA